MSSVPQILRISFASLCCGVALIGWSALAAAQDSGKFDYVCPNYAESDSPTDGERVGPLTMGRRLIGLAKTDAVVNCNFCHSPDGRLVNSSQFDAWVLKKEYAIWDEQDRHSEAYKSLSGPEARRMSQILGWDVALDNRCISCHATVPAQWLASGKTDARSLRDGPVSELLEQGVSCETCHGAAGNVENGKDGWVSGHYPELGRENQFKSKWRFADTKDKQSKFGFYDVRSPSSRARMCASCHIGDLAQGRFVTHEMYAAGHPPLPAFEVETFMRHMPPHWRLLRGSDHQASKWPDPLAVKDATVSAEFLEKTNDPYYAALRATAPGELAFDRTRALAVGAIVTWAQNARVAAEVASTTDFPLSPATDRWPELASFECAACHHDLQLSSWRAERLPPSTPGRPILQNWSSPLFVAVCKSLNKGQLPPELIAAEEFLAKATAKQPYGEQSEIANKLKQAAATVDDWAKRVEEKPFSRTDAMALLRSIASVGSAGSHDYESARHLVWGFEEVLREVDPMRQATDVLAAFDQAQGLFASELSGSAAREQAAKFDARQLQDAFKQLTSSLKSQFGE